MVGNPNKSQFPLGALVSILLLFSSILFPPLLLLNFPLMILIAAYFFVRQALRSR